MFGVLTSFLILWSILPAQASLRVFDVLPPTRPVQVPKLTRPITAPREIRVWSMFSEGPINARVIEFQEQSDGLFRRIGHHSWQATPNERTAQEFCQILLQGGVSRRLEFAALSLMARQKYIPPELWDFYADESLHTLHTGQLYYLETTSLIAANRVRELFGGTIPWSVISEILAPRTLTYEEARTRAEAGDPEILLRVRRATLRVTAGQIENERPWGPSGFAPLPWENDTDYSPFQAPRHQTPITFELGRFAELEGQPGEAERLVPLSSLIALHHWSLAKDIGGPNSIPLNAVGEFANALNRAHKTLFQRRYSMKPLLKHTNPDGKTKTILGTTLDQMLTRYPPTKFHQDYAQLDSLASAAGKEVSPEAIFTLIMMLREHFRSDLNLAWKEGAQVNDLTPEGPLVKRDFSSTFQKNLKARLDWSRPEASPFWPLPMREQLATEAFPLARLPTVRPFTFFEDDHGDQDWKSLTGLEPFVFSNLGLLQDPPGQSGLKIAMMRLGYNFTHSYIPFPPDLPILWVTADPKRLEELQAMGLKTVAQAVPGPKNQWRAFLTTVASLAAMDPGFMPVIEAQSRLQQGYWNRYRILQDLTGL